MIKTKTFLTILLSLLFGVSLSLYAQEDLAQKVDPFDFIKDDQQDNDSNLTDEKEEIFKTKYSSTVDFSSEGISVYNTGVTINATTIENLTLDFRGSVDGKIDEIDSDDFELGTFIKELTANYELEYADTILLFSLGKMPTGAKTDRDNPRQLGGVMGVRMSIHPTEINNLQQWLKRHNLKINRIDITRYDADSEERFDLNDLKNTDMTAVSLNLSNIDENIHAFYVYKRPDADNTYGVTSKSVGGIYMFDHPSRPSLFMMNHQSDSAFLDLDLNVLSGSIEISPGIRGTLSYTQVEELKSDSREENYGFSFSRKLIDSQKFKLKGVVGVRRETDLNNHTDEDIWFMRFEGTH